MADDITIEIQSNDVESDMGQNNPVIVLEGGTTDYNELSNKPSINEVTLSGDLSLGDIGVPQATSQLDNDSDFVSDSEYVHTDNNYTDSEKEKLAGIEAGAQANTVTGIQLNGTDVTPVSGIVNIEPGISDVSGLSDALSEKYIKPSGGIPSTDLSSAAQASLGNADTAYQKPSAGIPDSDLTSSVQGSLEKADNALQPTDIDSTLTATGKAADAKAAGDAISAKYTKPSGGIPDTDMTSAVRASLGRADSALQSSDIDAELATTGKAADAKATGDAISAKYTKPSGGIPDTDLSATVQASLDKADTAYQNPSGGIPDTDLTSAVQTSLGKADTALQSTDIDDTLAISGKAADAKAAGDAVAAKYTKPSGGIPDTDLTGNVQASLGKADTALQPVDIDDTLAITGKPADAKAVGLAVDMINTRIALLHNKPVSWAAVQDIVRSGNAGLVFALGDQLVCKKGNADLAWDIIGIDNDTPADPTYTHSMTLQLHDCYATAIQPGNTQAFYYCENGLAAGSYYFTIDPTYDSSRNTFSGYQFTLASAVPAGGQLCFGWEYGTNAGDSKVSSYASASDSVAIEDNLSVTDATTGTFLGNLTAAGDFSNNINSVHRIRYGSNNYKESAVRQWLNSSAAAGSVWVPQTKFDRPPAWATTEAGWMNGIDADFLAVIGEASISVSRNPICDGGGSDTLNDKFFLPSRENVYGGQEISGVSEGGAYAYYEEYSSLSAAGTGNDANRIKYVNSTAAAWWLRTPNSANSSDTRRSTTAGAITSNPASNTGNRVAPVCCII